MEPLGILLYGYNSTDSKSIQKKILGILDEDVIVISGSSKEAMKVIDILEQGPTDDFEDSEHKILVFLGFNDQQVSSVLNGFPKNDDLKRPIFCGLTEQNINWPLKDLIEHLVEEDEYWTTKRTG
jgi:hypothetical protein